VKSCAEIRPLIGAHLLGALDDDETTVLFTHLAHCQECAAKHSRLSQLMPLIDLAGSSEAPVGLPADAEERLLARTAPKRRRSTRLRRLVPVLSGALAGAAATLALVVGFGSLGKSDSAPQPTASVELSPTLEAPTATATAYVINQNGASTIAVEAQGLPAPRQGERYIVWLSTDHGSYALGQIEVNVDGWGTAILRSHYATWPGTRISILAAPAKSMNGGRARLLVRGTL
jgi:anti-sigma factor RsiW